MAETEYRRLSCRGCGVPVLPTVNLDGTLRKNQAEACSARCLQRKLAGHTSAWRKCKQCATSIEHLPLNTKYCSPQCRQRHDNSRKRSRVVVAHPEPLALRQCRQCGAEYQPAQAVAAYCSKSCCKKWHNAHSTKTAPARDRKATREIERQAKLLLALRAKQEKIEAAAMKQAALAVTKAMRAERACPTCGHVVPAGRRKAIYCSRKCYKNSEPFKAAKRAEKQKRKALTRGASKADKVLDIEVLRRDGWRCYLCGCETPESLRGTYEPNAPEVEHMTPVSRGGEHSYANVRCACRRCNAEKADMTAEEFIGVMHQEGGGWVQTFEALPF